MANAEGSGVSIFRRAWRVIRWPLGILALLYIALLAIGLPRVLNQKKSAEVVAAIHAARITMDDVDGKHLPPPPDPAQADATVEGIDANGNGIRDDVELAIFKLHPDSEKIRAAELQYAAELQAELNVRDTNTWKANTFEEDRGYQCISETYPREDLESYLRITKERSNEVENLQFNNEARNLKRKETEKFETSVSLPSSDFCDLEVN